MLILVMPNQVEYFKKRRTMEHKKEALYKRLESEGANRLPGTIEGAGQAPSPKS